MSHRQPPVVHTPPRPAYEARQLARRCRIRIGLEVRRRREQVHRWTRLDLAEAASHRFTVDDEAVRRVEAGQQTDLVILAPILTAVGLDLAAYLRLLEVEPW